mmetsp:Transcript_3216/g.11602  ORF Transcript_3216/g.11602 Transcript_3216/m.11602 type:complete len:210 (+) Transcript_3216:167-796(+)
MLWWTVKHMSPGGAEALVWFPCPAYSKRKPSPQLGGMLSVKHASFDRTSPVDETTVRLYFTCLATPRCHSALEIQTSSSTVLGLASRAAAAAAIACGPAAAAAASLCRRSRSALGVSPSPLRSLAPTPARTTLSGFWYDSRWLRSASYERRRISSPRMRYARCVCSHCVCASESCTPPARLSGWSASAFCRYARRMSSADAADVSPSTA